MKYSELKIVVILLLEENVAVRILQKISMRI